MGRVQTSGAVRRGQRTRPGRRSRGKKGLGPCGLQAVAPDFGGGVGLGRKKEWFAEVLTAGNWELWKAG